MRKKLLPVPVAAGLSGAAAPRSRSSLKLRASVPSTRSIGLPSCVPLVKYTPRSGDEAQLLRALNALRTLPGGYRDQKNAASVAPGFGLSQSEKLGAQALRAYRNALREALLPRLAMALEGEMRDTLRTPKREGLGEALAAYQSLYAGDKMDPKAVEEGARRVWRLPDAESAALLAHLWAGLEEGRLEVRHPRDEAIIRDARQKMAPAKTS